MNTNELLILMIDHGIICDDYTIAFDKCNDENIDVFFKLVSYDGDNCKAIISLIDYYYDKKMYNEMCEYIYKGLHKYTELVNDHLRNIDYIEHYVKFLAGKQDDADTYRTDTKRNNTCNWQSECVENKSLKYAVKLYRENEQLKNM